MHTCMQAKSTHNLQEEAEPVYISWGDPAAKIALLRLKGFLIVGLVFGLGTGLIFLRAYRGSSSKTPQGDDL